MDTDRSSGVGPLAWVTLGLLAFSWLVTSGLTAWEWVRFPPSGEDLLVGTVIWLFVAGPHLMFGTAVIRSGKHPGVVPVALTFAVLCASCAATIAAGELTGRQWEMAPQLGCFVVLLGWPSGILALYTTYRANPPTEPPDNGRPFDFRPPLW